MKLTLVRELATDTETMGSLYIDGKFFCYTLEDVPRIIKAYGDTSIPFRRDYKVKTTYSPRFKRDLPLVWTTDSDLSVRNRNGDKWEGIRFHGGNHHMHTLGCILVAKNRYLNKTTTFDYNGKKISVNNWIQGNMVNELIAKIGKATIQMEIVHHYEWKDLRITIDRNLPQFKLSNPYLMDDNICLIQNALNLKNIHTPKPIFDEAFRDSVIKYQELYVKNSKPDGWVGQKTLEAMGLIWNGYELESAFDYVNNKSVN